jgi:DNA-binding response OmpR family regulator
MRHKILLVDDNNELVEILRLSLRAAGFSITTASTGREALRKARDLVPDLILLDLMLPELDGFAVSEALRANPPTASVPILMFSGMSGQFVRYAGLESGGTDFITKPFNPHDLIQRIKDLLQKAAKAA